MHARIGQRHVTQREVLMAGVCENNAARMTARLPGDIDTDVTRTGRGEAGTLDGPVD